MKAINFNKKEREYILKYLPVYADNTDIGEKIYKRVKRANKRIKVASAKGKGRGLQYWVCHRISELLRIPFDQQDDQCLIHSREMGQAGTDIILRGKAFKLFPYSVECKNMEKIGIMEMVNQAKRNEGKDTDWMVVHKRKTLNEPVVIFSWKAFAKLFKKIIK